MPFEVSNIWRTKKAVGLNFGAGSFKAVRVVRTEDGPMVESACVKEWETDSFDLAAAVVEARRGVLDDRTRQALGLNSRQSTLHFFQAPFDKPEMVKQVLIFEVEPLFLTPVEEMVVDYLPLSSSRENDRPSVVFQTSLEIMSGVMEDAAGAGLEPGVVLPELLGLIAAGERLFENSEEPRRSLLLDLGATQTQMALFEGDRPVSARAVYYGGRDLTLALSLALKMDPDEAEQVKRETDLASAGDEPARTELLKAWQYLLLEIERTLVGAFDLAGGPAPEVILAGGGARTPGLAAYLSEQLNISVTSIAEYLDGRKDLGALTPETVCPFGLALLVMKSGYTPNLRQGQTAAFEVLKRYKAPLLCLAVGFLLLALINIGGLYYSYHLEASKHAEVKAEIERLYRETVPGVTRIVAPLAQMRQEVENVAGSLAGLGSGRGRVLDMLLDVSRLAGLYEGLRVTDLALNPQTLELQGEGGSFEVIDRFKNELDSLPYFSEASLGGARMDPTTRVLTFKISLKRRTG